ncbi:MAG: cysteine--1-D-myo-inosityl 2-amino-2-deoxy-alpha-D-glucopyranoside ligase [Actinomycetota bacterium]|nr:cysteine--1-D-myo-inosityl 2-amino-2-deoxy-alpha-D-glucopyranoside ligase [Actinomycetota bacterium]
MRAWSGPDVPALTDTYGYAPTVLVHDTASGGYVGTPTADQARLYVCGITPYDATHLGHAATYLAFDLLVRAWRDAGHDVVYVQNVTDVDDPLLERAGETGEDWRALADCETELFRADMAALRIVPPTHFVGAVESMPLIVDLLQQLRDRGATYEVDGDLYFPVAADPSFGTVSRLPRATMVELFGERGGDPDRSGKKDPLDPLLWQRQRPGEPAWDSPFGAGRPGWHVECSAIALRHLGIAFDVQGGGNDLVFPHHEMSAAHAYAASGQGPFARAYVHAGMVAVDGEKMSKSKGNLVFVSALRDAGVDPMAIRLALLDHHYRDDWEWTDADLARAQDRLQRWRAAVAAGSGPDPGNTLIEVRSALAHDLDAPRALVALDTWAEAALAHAERDADSMHAGSRHADSRYADSRYADSGHAAATVTALCDARLGVRL